MRDEVKVAVKLDGVLTVEDGMIGNDVLVLNVGKTGERVEGLEEIFVGAVTVDVNVTVMFTGALDVGEDMTGREVLV